MSWERNNIVFVMKGLVIGTFASLSAVAYRAVLGKSVYRRKESLLPRVNTKNVFIRFFSFCGRQSLWLYLLHQPLFSGIFYLILLSKRA